MKYKELISEYTSLIKDEADRLNSLYGLKKGYISYKTISGKSYSYLQYREDGSLVSEYLRESSLPGVRAELDKRTHILDDIDKIKSQLKKLEAAAEILDSDLYRQMIIIRRCAFMELLPLEKRKRTLEFCRAMAALEGIPVSIDTEGKLSGWANGELNFHECFTNALRTYGLTED